MGYRIRIQPERRWTNLRTFIKPESRSVLRQKLKMRINLLKLVKALVED